MVNKIEMVYVPTAGYANETDGDFLDMLQFYIDSPLLGGFTPKADNVKSFISVPEAQRIGVKSCGESLPPTTRGDFINPNTLTTTVDKPYQDQAFVQINFLGQSRSWNTNKEVIKTVESMIVDTNGLKW